MSYRTQTRCQMSTEAEARETARILNERRQGSTPRMLACPICLAPFTVGDLTTYQPTGVRYTPDHMRAALVETRDCPNFD